MNIQHGNAELAEPSEGPQPEKEALEILARNPWQYGRDDYLTRAGFLAVAEAGKVIWNAWIKNHGSQTPDFSDLNFITHPVDFTGFEFPSKKDGKSCVDFSGSIFGEKTVFRDAKFGNKANFSDTIFIQANFENSSFDDEASFENSTFYGKAFFHKTKFGFHARFTNCTFQGTAVFRAASFGDNAIFNYCKFRSSSFFDASAKPNDHEDHKSFNSIYFYGSIFEANAHFENRKFTSTTIFGKTKRELMFSSEVMLEKPTVFYGIPYFHGCKMNQDTSFDGAKFNAYRSPEAARAYRTLKLAMEQLKATREEQKFFRLEMKAEQPNLGGAKFCVSFLYGLFSDYGFSLWRPIAWLLIFSLAFGESYLMLADTCRLRPDCLKIANDSSMSSSEDRTSAIRKFALASASPVPGLDKMQTELRAPLFGHQGWVPITALVLEILHKIIALVMVFLFALALRNLFKMKS